ncbi:hybrid sensor histidine kinase/response regulator [Allohahella sp. A8]|uniref:hybrid sensor histidine kinase/response regulator n=1 Tax=Allohahella sp. A8 TaxID=3141461 RepID=UPI003A8055F6
MSALYPAISLMLLYLFSNMVLAQALSSIDPEQPSLLLSRDAVTTGNLSSYLFSLPDTPHQSIGRISSLPVSAWNAPDNFPFNEGFNSHGFWFRADVLTPADLPVDEWVAVLHNTHVDKLRVWWLEHPAGRLIELDTSAIYQRYPGRFSVVPLSLEAERRYTLFLYMETEWASQAPMSVIPYSTHLLSELTTLSALHFALGALGILATISLVVGRVLRDAALTYYSVFIACIALVQGILQGVGAQWPIFGSQWNSTSLIFTFITLAEMAAILFTREQMRTRGNRSISTRILSSMICLSASTWLAMVIFPIPVHWFWQIIIVKALAYVAVGVWIGIYSSVRQQWAAIYYSAAIVIFFIGTILLTLNKFGWLPMTVYTEHLQLVGSVASSVIFLLSIGERVKLQRRSKMQAKQRALDYELMARSTQARLLAVERQTSEALEQQVSARTAELELALEELQQAKQEAEQANEEKARFLAAASHDIRQPLHALALLSEGLPRPGKRSTGDLLETSRYVRQAVADLVNLIDTLFDLSKLDNDLLEPELQSLSLGPLLLSFTETMRPVCTKAGVSLVFEPGRLEGLAANADPVLMFRILSILVDNAVQHANCTQLTIMVVPNGARSACEILVTDNGIGIAAHEQGPVFEAFYQLHNPERNRSKGMGLGLALCRRLTEVMGFSLTLESAPGAGCQFRIGLPVVHEQTLTPRSMDDLNPDWTESSKLRVLLVDDDYLARKATKQLLLNWGLDCHAVASTPAALQALNEQWQPDFLVLDFRLPGTDNGLGLANMIRARLGREIPVLIVSGDIGVTINDRSIVLLHKPLKPSRLRAVIEGFIRLADDPVAAEAASEA